MALSATPFLKMRNARFIDGLVKLLRNVFRRGGTRRYMPRLSQVVCARRWLSGRRLGLAKGRDSYQVQFIVNIRGRRQVAHCGLKGLVAHPVLNSPYVEPPSQHSRGVG